MGYTKKKTTRGKTKSKKTKQTGIWKILISLLTTILASLAIVGVVVNTPKKDVKVQIEYNETSTPLTIKAKGDAGEYIEEIPTVEEIDGGGKFQDMIDPENPALYYEKGAIEEVDTSSPEAFKNSTLNRCIVASNFFGAQCVSLARAFWWDYAGFDVSTCGTGLAKGMMECSDENARDKFKVIWNTDEIQEGTWIVLNGKTTGHVCMALSKVNNGYVTCLGENQGGIPCEYGVGGAGTNIININVKNFIGGYTPLSYISTPSPEPAPSAPDTGKAE